MTLSPEKFDALVDETIEFMERTRNKETDTLVHDFKVKTNHDVAKALTANVELLKTAGVSIGDFPMGTVKVLSVISSAAATMVFAMNTALASLKRKAKGEGKPTPKELVTDEDLASSLAFVICSIMAERPDAGRVQPANPKGSTCGRVAEALEADILAAMIKFRKVSQA